MVTNQMECIAGLKPGVGKNLLYLLAGGMWSAVGIMLVRLGLFWITPLDNRSALLIALAGFIVSLPIYRFGFSKFAMNNINRIAAVHSEKVCIFAFQAWTSYPLAIFMIALGVFLRKYSPVPKPLLSVVYIGIGFSLILASLHYYIQTIRGIRLRKDKK
jgi:hypothetical protein